MMDRLVCADGGNPDPTTTHGKNPEEAKALELKGWDYPKHLKGRIFSVIVHGDAVGAERVCAALTDWLIDMELVSAGAMALLDRYIGYYEPYATSQEAHDKDKAIDLQVRFTSFPLTVVGFPARGYVFIFYSPADGTRLVKRVVGLPGDTIQLRNDVLYLYGVPQHYSSTDAAAFRHDGFEDAN